MTYPKTDLQINDITQQRAGITVTGKVSRVEWSAVLCQCWWWWCLVFCVVYYSLQPVTEGRSELYNVILYIKISNRERDVRLN